MEERCVYCGEQANTRDHVVPSSFFPKPKPDDLITVPSCYDCNNSYSDDEEYLRNILSIADLELDGKSKDIWIQKVKRGIRRNNKLLKELSDSLKIRDAYYGDLYLGKRYTFKANMEKINRVIKKIIKGLFYHHYGRRLSKNYRVGIFEDEQVPEELFGLLEQLKTKEIGEGVFRYKHKLVTEDKNNSVWSLNFYKNNFVQFICYTGNKKYAKDSKNQND